MRDIINFIGKLRKSGIKYIGETEKEVVIILLALMIIGGSITLIAVDSPLVTTLLFGGWLFGVFVFKLSGRASIIGGFVFLSLCPILLSFKGDSYAIRSAYIAYLFLIIGTAQLIGRAFLRNQ